MSRRSWAEDLAIAGMVVVLGQLEAWAGALATHRQTPYWGEALVYAITGSLLVLRRRTPLICLGLIFAVSVLGFAVFGSPEGLGVMLPGLVAAYSVARWERRWPTWWGLVLVVALWAAWDALDRMDTSPRMHGAQAFWLGPWVISWLLGALVRSQALNLEQRRATRQQREAQAVAEERNRIARELHDVIGHSVSVMTVQASAVRRRLQAGQSVEREALESVEQVGREALAEMRRMVGVLRETTGDAGREPPPGLDQLPRLIEQVQASGLPVRLTVTGDERPLAPGLDLTAYRLVQEGLTNTMRHALYPTSAQVVISYRADELELAVTDDGRPGDVVAEPGHGLLGLRERVAVYGGHLLARRHSGGGFELIATLPLEPA